MCINGYKIERSDFQAEHRRAKPIGVNDKSLNSNTKRPPHDPPSVHDRATCPRCRINAEHD